ncbi:alpha/beta hydrolase [Micromonospora sp. NPDC047707]|uniref:alpha/beta hydrolase n=1 Tax=Micromonospora sp. NPDC047707 TaxID=3154498 RepID=UPI003451B2BB
MPRRDAAPWSPAWTGARPTTRRAGCGHVTTANTARDLDAIRAALGEEKASFLGTSYGSALGAAYASMFPDRTDRIVIDDLDGQARPQHCGEGVEEVERLVVGPESPDDRERLGEVAHGVGGVGEGQAVCGVLPPGQGVTRPRPDADAEVEAPAGDDVDDRGDFWRASREAESGCWSPSRPGAAARSAWRGRRAGSSLRTPVRPGRH